MFVKRLMFMAPEDEGSGVSGPGSPSGEVSSNPSPTGAGGGSASSDPGATASDRGGAPPAEENRIPYSRVKEMLAQERARTESAYTEKLKGLEGQLSKHGQAWDKVADGLGRTFGFVKDEPPKFVDEASHHKAIGELREEMNRTLASDREVLRAEASLEKAKAKYAELFESDPDLEETIVAKWGRPGAPSIDKIIEAEVKREKSKHDRILASYQKVKDEQGQTQVLKPGGGGGTVTNPSKGGPGMSTREARSSKIRELLKNTA